MTSTWTIREAARACGVSPDTVRRRLAEMRHHGAEKDDSGAWRLPPAALYAVGLVPQHDPHHEQQHAPDPWAAPYAAPPQHEELPQGSALRQRIAELEKALAIETVKREAAEALAAERAASLERADLALRASLTLQHEALQRPVPSTAELVEQTTPSSRQEPRRRRWGRRSA